MEKSLQTTLTANKNNINHDNTNILNPKFCNNNTLMKTKATIT